MYLPPPPPSQGLDSKTFTPPPLDGSTCVPDLIEFHARYSEHHPLFVYRGPVGQDVQFTWSNFADAIRYCARLVVKSTGLVPSSSDSPPTVAILANTDTVTYAILLLGILRAGLVPFPISPRNSASAVLHLLETSDAHHVLLSEDHVVQKLTTTATANAKFPVFFYHVTKEIKSFILNHDHDTKDSNSTEFLSSESVIIMHSSGSTGFPKTTRLTQTIILQYARIAYYGDVDFCGQIVSIHAVPMFHMQGVAFLLRAVATGLVLAVFPPQTQAVPPTPARVLGGIKDDRCTMLTCVPSFLETWSSDKDAIEVLISLKAVIFSGAPLSQKAGDILAAAGVNLHMYYAGTEVGCVSKFIPRTAPAQDWQYISFSPHLEVHFIPQDSENMIFELVTVESPAYTPGAINTSVNGKNAFATGDLFIRHAVDPSRWRVHGRVDDLIMLSTGEKTIPGPIEAVFMEKPRITKTVMFGRGRPHNGIILELTASNWSLLDDPREKQKFEEVLWYLMKQANAAAPSHSRLYKEMILLAHPSKPFLLTSKGNVQRKAVLELYASEIEQAYRNFSLTTEIILPRAGNSEINYPLLINKILTEVLGEPVGELVDIFQHGCDSIQATRIRSMVIAALLPSNPDLVKDSIPVDVVYQCPRSKDLVVFFQRFMNGKDLGTDQWTKRIAFMNAMVARYTEGIPHRQATKSEEDLSSPSGDIVLLTGTTGALGSYLLAGLVNRSDIHHIYAVNRHHPRDSRPLLERQIDGFTSRNLDPSILRTAKITLIEADVSAVFWNVPNKFLHQITVVIHAAWPVDFNRSLSSFSGALEGLRNLIDFVAGLPKARLLFISSTGLFRNWPSARLVVEGPANDPAVAAGLGYTESKWVAERVLDIAAERLRIPVSVVRVGQLSGGIKGAWNTAEWFPSMVQSAIGLGCLPICDRLVSWLPVDVAAQGTVELLRCGQSRYFHLEHPYPVRWTAIFEPLASMLGAKLIPFEEWLSQVRDRAFSDTQGRTESPKPTNETKKVDASYPRVLRILPYFESKDNSGAYCMAKKPGLSVENTVGCLPSSYMDIAPLNEGDVKLWVEYWRSVGFLNG
ncbi:acetyl-CoA synthetase-like protein [Collybia nuda]|uniref:Acetyl-CoA synthetase-like protein n=1 Tax=Collybia nuda TaxID=64659 RepID=A0A9P5YE17_9AGAR|nr:acetyl-CoA synthetase-like protein [Collybia nuda]